MNVTNNRRLNPGICVVSDLDQRLVENGSFQDLIDLMSLT